MPRNKPWFGPIPSIGRAVCPCSWEGYAVTVAFVLGLGLLTLVRAPIPRSIAMALIVAAFGAIVLLTWENPDAEGRRGWRDRLLTRRASVGAALLLLLMAAFVAATYACEMVLPHAVYVGACRRAPSGFKAPAARR